MKNSFKQAIVGGTFDHLHLGHQKLIDTAFEQSDYVTIGLTQPNMYQNKLLSELIENYEIRETNLKNYLEEKNYAPRAKIIPITDIYGTTLQEKEIEAIFATEENLKNVELINAKRKEIGFPELEVINVTYVKDENGENIMSERIRKGEIDRNGLVYKNLFKQMLNLSVEQRDKLRNPLGEVLKNTEEVLSKLNEQTIVIAVGDIIVSSLIEKGYTPAISIIDFKTRREVIEAPNQSTDTKVLNAQGSINNEAVQVFQEKLDAYLQTKEKQTIIIEGEEDLLALPAILLAPLGSVVLYGQFDQGVVVNKISAETKKKAQAFLT